MPGWLAVALWVLLAGIAGAQDRIILEEVLGSWQGDDEVQFVELRMVADGQQNVAGRAELVFDDLTASDQGRRFFSMTRNLARGTAGAKVLVGTGRLAQVAGVTPDFTLPAGFLRARGGRVCWQALDAQGAVGVVDCLAWGDFSGPTFGFGAPTRVGPDNRSLQRTGLSGVIRQDWQGRLEPTPENNAGQAATLPTLCGDGAVSQGEECDGTRLGGATCASLGFARGKLSCTQCHFDTGKCTFCGNGELNDTEQCDGVELGGATCAALGFTGGSLGCTDRCALDTAACDDTFYAPGGGPLKSDCQAEWLVRHAGAKPDGTGTAPPRLACRDGDVACDGGTAADSCSLAVRVCFGRSDPRLPKCVPAATSQWALRSPEDAALASALAAAVAALGAGDVTGGEVAFPLPVPAEGRCSAPVDIVVPARRKVKLKAVTTTAGRAPRDGDTLRIACVP